MPIYCHVSSLERFQLIFKTYKVAFAFDTRSQQHYVIKQLKIVQVASL